MQSLQKNVLSMGEEGMPYDNIFVWNAYLTEAIRLRCENTIWTIALVHGNFKQVCSSLFVILMVLIFHLNLVYIYFHICFFSPKSWNSIQSHIQLLQLITSLSNNDFLHPETHYLFWPSENAYMKKKNKFFALSTKTHNS